MGHNIPRTRSTQHPDNVRAPFFAVNKVISGGDEIKEAFYAFSHLGIKEQLWDFEGKEVDNAVIRKLLTRYEVFFRNHKLGKDRFLTYRVPNPDIEKSEGKILLETLENIPRSFDVAKLFYGGNGQDVNPILEVDVPMVTNAKTLMRIAEYYKKFVAGKENATLFKGDQPLSNWIGDFFPKKIRVVPLIEDKEPMLDAHNIIEEFINHQKIEDYQRVWLARSDPALNYSSTGCVLIEKIALQRLHQLSEKLSVTIYPMLGCGSAPFRGNFKPTNVDGNMKGYPSVHTFTLQSAFKYDYDLDVVRKAVDKIEEGKAGKPLPVEEQELLPLIDKLAKAYQEQIKLLAPLINDMAKHVPARRKRKLHIGLFGYSRKGEGGVSLPRAIKFCASLYSLGLPPELLGLHVLNQKEVDTIIKAYPTFEQDFKDAAQFINNDNLKSSLFPKEIVKQAQTASKLFEFDVNREHKKITDIILTEFKSKNPVLTEDIERAGWVRGFLG